LAASQKEIFKLIQNVKTGWICFYLMLERFLSLKEVVIIFQVQNLCETDFELLTNADWKFIEAFITILKPLHDITVELSSKKHESVSKITPVINMLTHYYGDLAKGVQGPVEKDLMSHIQNQLEFQFGISKLCTVWQFQQCSTAG
jgi:hypothetical protein